MPHVTVGETTSQRRLLASFDFLVNICEEEDGFRLGKAKGMRPSNFIILVVDDDLNDQALIRRAFRQNGVTCPVECVADGHEAVAYLKGTGQYADRERFPYPSFIISDLRMTLGDGLSVLEHLKNHPQWGVIPTMILSSSNDPDDVRRSYLLGATAYLVKPSRFEELRRLLRIFYEFWSACEVPAVDGSGRWTNTESRGKLGERFDRPN